MNTSHSNWEPLEGGVSSDAWQSQVPNSSGNWGDSGWPDIASRESVGSWGGSQNVAPNPTGNTETEKSHNEGTVSTAALTTNVTVNDLAESLDNTALQQEERTLENVSEPPPPASEKSVKDGSGDMSEAPELPEETQEVETDDEEAPEEVPVERQDKSKKRKNHPLGYYRSSLTFCLREMVKKEDLKPKPNLLNDHQLMADNQTPEKNQAVNSAASSAKTSPDSLGELGGSSTRNKRKSGESTDSDTSTLKHKRLCLMTKQLTKLGYVFQPQEHYRHPDTPPLKDAEAKYM